MPRERVTDIEMDLVLDAIRTVKVPSRKTRRRVPDPGQGKLTLRDRVTLQKLMDTKPGFNPPSREVHTWGPGAAAKVIHDYNG